MTQHTINKEISAPSVRVWDVMLGEETYPIWTAAFHEGSTFVGSWDQGSSIRFIGPGQDGSLSGLVALITDSRRGEYVRIEYLGEVRDGVDDLTSESALQWAGGTESYRFSEANGVTTLTVELESNNPNPEIQAMLGAMVGMWAPALDKLKSLVEG